MTSSTTEHPIHQQNREDLGGFDGYFIYKGLLKYVDEPSSVNTIINPFNKFIVINYLTDSGIIEFKDSYRIFPVGLNDLCNIFGIVGKLHKYLPEFNNISILNNLELLKSLIDYNKRDCLSLLEALLKAQGVYLDKYNVDLSTIVSTSSLANL